MKETLKISDRFNLIKKLGQGTFSKIFSKLKIQVTSTKHGTRDSKETSLSKLKRKTKTRTSSYLSTMF